ncbi:sulfide/dihydroorotate dehydrogenase-like FAD/NAD-binding protein [Paludibacterium sp.]|uniref:sulfide/dihydroorotate dehydrogenase-like FAD/NAD-binding protein n=1 Tax=Paludibacterium sp. TaxID=1917523 RepID=UPI0025FFAFDF|nr:sulfide/dihydroorotate dehydrogenase-like FAD/NAD-binding protein [Paludibacterium sp.]MBV8646392.1 sulfide/dihydroorotate dehydrogenase-like FAD/NAD-binding protein [Paludibacterium sp.]
MSTQPSSFHPDELQRFAAMDEALAQTREQVAELEQSDTIGAYKRQMKLLQRRLLNQPDAFRDIFIGDGMQAVVWEFQQKELGADFVHTLWRSLLAEDDASLLLMRFIWNLPLKLKRKFVLALDQHLSAHYPMFKGLSDNWPLMSHIPPYIRSAEARSDDFGLVNQGYLGYMNEGFSAREVDLFVWLEALRDKQCLEKPCELGEHVEGKTDTKGGCPVKIHIPEMIALLGKGHFKEAMQLIESCNPLPNVTGRVCPQELQCQGVCAHQRQPIEIGQIEWFLPQREKLRQAQNGLDGTLTADPWTHGDKPPIAVVGSGPSGLINAYLLAAEGFPVTVFEAFHELGGVLRYGIPEFRLPNELIDDVVGKIKRLGGRFVTNFVVGKTATIEALKEAGFYRVFVGTGAGLPRFMNVPGEHLLNVMSANEFLTRVNLMQGLKGEYATPLPETRGKHVAVIGGGNTAMDSARTARRLGAKVTIVYRRTRDEMPARVEELHHALEEDIALKVLRGPSEFIGDEKTHFVTHAKLDVMTLGEPDASGRRSPKATGETEMMPVDLVIMALGNDANPIIKDSEPRLKTTRWATLEVNSGSQQTSLEGVFSGGDATRGGSTAIRAAGDGQSAAREMIGTIDCDRAEIHERVAKARRYTELGSEPHTIVDRKEVATGIVELEVRAPLVARTARAGQFVRVLAWPKGELIPLTLADWDAAKGTITLVIQGVGASSIAINRMKVGEAFTGIAGPLGLPSALHPYDADSTVVFTAGGVGLPPVYPILREHLRLGNHATLISGVRSADLAFWNGEHERVAALQAEFGDRLDVVYTSNDGTLGVKGFVTTPLQQMLDAQKAGNGRNIAEVVTIGPPLMMRAVCDLTRPYGVKTVASLNSIMVDATGMCGACMVPVNLDGKLVRKHACIDGPEIDGHLIDWDKFLPRFGLFKHQESESLERQNHGG